MTMKVDNDAFTRSNRAGDILSLLIINYHQLIIDH